MKPPLVMVYIFVLILLVCLFECSSENKDLKEELDKTRQILNTVLEDYSGDIIKSPIPGAHKDRINKIYPGTFK